MDGGDADDGDDDDDVDDRCMMDDATAFTQVIFSSQLGLCHSHIHTSHSCTLNPLFATHSPRSLTRASELQKMLAAVWRHKRVGQ